VASPDLGVAKRFSPKCLARSREPTLEFCSIASLAEIVLVGAEGVGRGFGLVGTSKQLYCNRTSWKRQRGIRLGWANRRILDVVGFVASAIPANPNGERKPICFGFRRSISKKILSSRTLVFLFGDLGHLCFGNSPLFVAN